MLKIVNMKSKDIKKIIILIVFMLIGISNQSQAVETKTATSNANNKSTYMLTEKENTTSTIYDKIRHMFSVVDNRLTALDKALPTLTYKTLDFKAGVGMDFGSNGVAISLIGNMYYNFTPNISAFTGVEYKYNMYQIKHKLSNSIFIPETRTKMDLLFKLGTRFKVKENFKVSPYVILGMGYGSVKQETQYYSSNETIYENIEQQTFKGTTKIIKTTNKYDVDGATEAVTNLDYESHKNNFNGNYGIKYQINEAKTEYIPVYEIKSYNEAQNILNNGIDVYKNTMTYNNNESYMNFGILPVVNLYKNSKEHGNALLTLLEGAENGVSHQYGYQKNTNEFNANNLFDVYQTINGNGGRIFAINTNQDYSEYAKHNTEPYNTSSILHKDINQYINLKLDNFGDLSDVISVTINQETLKQKIQSGELQLSNVEGLSQTQYIVNTNNPLNYNQNLMIIKAKNLKNEEDTYFYYLPNNDGTTISLSEAQKQIEEYNNQAVVDKREKLEDSVTTTTETANKITQNPAYTDHIETTDATKINTIINQKQKVFFKGGLGVELMFYNRFFVRLEYKYAQLGATNVLIHNVNSYKHTTTYNKDYTITQTTNVNNIYQNQYTPTYINSGVLTNYNNGAISGSDVNGNVFGVEITKGELDTSKSTSITQNPIYNYGEKKIVNQNDKYLGKKTSTENQKTTFHMHEISFGFGFYFL